MDYQQPSSWTKALSLPQCFAARYAVIRRLIDECPQHYILRRMHKRKEGMLVRSSTCDSSSTINSTIGYSGFLWLSLLSMMGNGIQQSVPASLRSWERTTGCRLHKNQPRSGIIDAWMLIRSKRHCNRSMSTSRWRWDNARQYREKQWIENELPHPQYRLACRSGSMPSIYEPPDPLGWRNGNCGYCLKFFAEHLHMEWWQWFQGLQPRCGLELTWGPWSGSGTTMQSDPGD